MVLTLRHGRAAERDALDLADQLAVSQAEARRWRSEARDLMNGLAAAIDEQFDRWALSPAEKAGPFRGVVERRRLRA
jgi:hypothetical protein